MANIATFFPNSSLLPLTSSSKNLNSSYSCILFNSQHSRHKRHYSLLPALASSLSLPINVDYLEREFSGHGVSFESIGDSCVVKMGLQNGSVASLVLPSGLITSYKPHMWHGSRVEVLHTSVSERENGEPVIQGGVSMDFKILTDNNLPWSPSIWSLHDVKGSTEKYIQVELISVAPNETIEVRCLVTLHPDLLGSEISINNTSSSPLRLVGSVISHLTVSSPSATYAVGLQGSSYSCKQPMNSDFSIIPPELSKKTSKSSGQSWAQKTIQGFFSGWNTQDEKDDDEVKNEGDLEEETEGEEVDDYAHLTQRMSRIYSTAPRQFTIIDRGRRNSVVVRRSGFDELYVFSPGSDHELYGRYAYICTGPSAMLKPVVLGAGDVWRGAQYLHNPNL